MQKLSDSDFSELERRVLAQLCPKTESGDAASVPLVEVVSQIAVKATVTTLREYERLRSEKTAE